MMWSTEDEKRLSQFSKIELVRMVLKMEEDYADQSFLLDSVTEDLEAMREIALKYIEERAEMRKEIKRLKGNK